ncbi:MAG: 3,4-dihydroxy-2-butanone-4-phosphate synthase [Phycisphaerales bacterium]|nr:3,4-dihydroxy-2-butanone-4-phosphate synthase [Phycisphaerales bacterium]
MTPHAHAAHAPISLPLPSPVFAPIDEILTELRAGRMVILTDDEDRENEGDLILPAQFVTPEAITFMLSVARGYLCLSLTESDCDRLDLVPQAAINTTVRGTAFTVSIDGHPRHGFTTGVSAKERARAITMLIDPAFGPSDFVRPGHINPLRSRDGGVLVRIGQTEGSIDLCRLAGLYPAAAIIEIMGDDGEMARLPQLIELARKHNLKMCSVRQIIEHRLSRSAIVERLDPKGGRPLRTPEGDFTLFAFRSLVDPLPHLALTTGGIGRLCDDGTPVETPEPTLVRVHRRDLLGDIFLDQESSPNGPTGSILRSAMRQIHEAGRGVIVYLRPQFMGEDWRHQLQRPFDHSDDDRPEKSVPASMLEYGTGSQILRSLGLSKLRLLTNSHTDYPKLDAFGLEIVDRVPITIDDPVAQHNPQR